MKPWMAGALIALAACNGRDTDTGPEDTDTDSEVEVAALVGADDGAYVVGFQRAGDHFALGEFTIAQNVVTGSVRSSDGLDVTALLTVMSDSTLRLDDLTSDGEHDLALSGGRVANGIFEGTYTVDGEPGTFAGRRTAGVVEAPHAEFDGDYEVAIVLDAEEVAATVAHVRSGAVTTTVVDQDGSVTEVRGFVTSDGTFVLSEAVQSNGDPVLAEATIDQDTFDVSGVYRSGDHVGRIVGRRAD